MEKQEVLNDLILIFNENTNNYGLTNVHGVYDSLKDYMLKLKDEINNKL